MTSRGELGAIFVLERVQALPRPTDAVFAFFSDPMNLETITPPWLRFRIVEAPERLERGSLLRYRLSLFGVPIAWRTLIAAWQPPRSFTDIQLSGPYPLWEHTHRFTPLHGGTEIYDHVRYRVPGGLLAPILEAKLVGRWLDDIFDYRRERLADLLGDAGVGDGTSSSKDASRP